MKHPDASSTSHRSALAHVGQFVTGLLLSSLVTLAGMFLWMLLFDRTGGEPGARTVWGTALAFPVLLVFVVYGTYVWCCEPSLRVRVRRLAVLLGGSFAFAGVCYSLNG